MSIIRIFFRRRGATLVELLATVALIVIVVSTLSVFFPQSSRALIVNRQRLTANQMAQTLLQATKRTPYDLLPTTAGTCDCVNNFQAVSSTMTTTDSVLFTQQACVDFLSHTTLAPECGLDDGLKRIRVLVSWNYGTDNNGPITHFVDTQSTVSRL